MRHLIASYLDSSISRRGLFEALAGLGFTAAAAQSLVAPLEASESGQGATKMTGTGGELVVAQMKAAGVEYLFTNPGSFEVGFFDAFLGQDHTQLIMGLHEGIVISLADGYYRTSGKPGFVNINVIAGTAQAAGQMYNASKDGSALVVTAGLNDNELWSDDAGLAPRPGFDQKEINRQFTKISWESREPRSLALMLRRAFKVATAPPGGPTYLAMAHHALEAKDVEALILPGERFTPESRMRPAKDAVERAAKALVEAQRPVLVAGDEVWKTGGCDELLKLAEKLGVPVTNQGQGYDNFPAHHPQNLGRFNQNHKMLAGADLVLSIGAPDFGGRVVPRGPEAPLAAKFIRLTANADVISRNYPTDLVLAGTPREGLRDLNEAIDSITTANRRKQIAKPRAQALATYTKESRAKAEAAARKNFGQGPVHPDELGARIASVADDRESHGPVRGVQLRSPRRREDARRQHRQRSRMGYWRVRGGQAGRARSPSHLLHRGRIGNVQRGRFLDPGALRDPRAHRGFEQPQLPDRPRRLLSLRREDGRVGPVYGNVSRRSGHQLCRACQEPRRRRRKGQRVLRIGRRPEERRRSDSRRAAIRGRRRDRPVRRRRRIRVAPEIQLGGHADEEGVARPKPCERRQLPRKDVGTASSAGIILV